jgi:hypothetical protein
MTLLVMQLSAVTLCPLGLNILLSTLFSYTLTLCISIHVREQLSNPRRTKHHIMVQHILIF